MTADLEGCATLQAATRGCQVVMLGATEIEAAPLVGALRRSAVYAVATKKILVGWFADQPNLDSECPEGREREVVVAISGCDKANAAHVLTCLLQAMKPAPMLVLQVGVAGAFPKRLSEQGDGEDAPASQPGIGDLAIASSEIYSDTGSSSPGEWISARELAIPVACVNGVESGGNFPFDAALVQEAVKVVEELSERHWPRGRPAVFTGPFVTASCVTGIRANGEDMVRRWGAIAESMEGAAAAHICALYDVPFLEIRGISNLIVDRDRSSWEIERAAEVAGRAALALVAAVDRLSTGGARRQSVQSSLRVT